MDWCRAPASQSPRLEQILNYAAMITGTGKARDRPTPDTTPRYIWAYELEWYRRNFHWYHFMTLVVPLVPIYIGVQHVSLKENTAIMALIWAIIGGFSLTIGYHRLWSHRSFQACTGIKVLLAVLGAAQNQWSIIWWVRHHRAHHQYTDTDQDPYNAKRGLLFSHIGWLLGLNQAAWGPVDVSDLENDPVVVWQQRLYYPIVVLVGFVLPAAVAHYGWNDWNGGMLYGGLIRIIVVQQVTFLNNSVAHAPWAGSQPYGTGSTARNVSLLAIFTLGEGNHNFHHTFPIDYRNGIEWYEPDFSRWLIWLWGKLGLASELKTVSPLEIELARHRQHPDHTEDVQRLSHLPQMTWEKYISQANRGHRLVAIDGVVHDVTDYMDDHPGGCDLIQGAIGKDATALYHGHHPHSLHAEAILGNLRVSLIGSI